MQTITLEPLPLQPDMSRVNGQRAADLAAARAGLASQRSIAGNPRGGPIPVAAPAPASPTPLIRANNALKSVVGGEPGLVTKALGGAARTAAKVAPAVGVGMEALDVGKVAMNPNATGIDVATQAAEGAGRLGAAATGAGVGGMVAGPAGAVVGGALGYLGGDRLIRAGRSFLGVDAASPVDNTQPLSLSSPVVAATDPATTPSQRATVPAVPAQRQSQDISSLAAIPGPSTVASSTPVTGNTAAPGGSLSVIPVSRGGGYSGTPGFTASGGNVSTSAELSAARAAAADRGDTDALAASYQANGGTFLGRTAAQDQVASLNKAALMSPRGSRAEKSFLTQAAAVGGQEQARRTLDLAETKQAGDQAVQAAQIGQAEATTTGLQQQNQTREQQRKMLQEIADLDPRTDPDGKIRQAKIDAYIATVHGKDIDPKYSVIEEGTGTFDLNGRENTRKVALAHRTGQIIRGQAPAGAPPKGVEGQIMRDAAGNRVQFKNGNWVELK